MNKLIEGINDLQTCSPSAKKVWWIGKCGHEWQSKKVLPGFNDLESQLPHIAKEWHPIKNAGLKASQVSYGSSKKAWWLGKCGHEWQASISSRQSANCPFCGRRKLLAGFNDLNTTFPQLAKEWHPSKNDKLFPSDVMPMSSRKVWWLGPCGHEWQASISSRSNGANCPYCCNKAVLSGFNDLSFKCPELIEKWHYEMNDPLRPETLSIGSDRKVWWKCNNCSHVWKKTIRLMVKHRTCPICKR